MLFCALPCAGAFAQAIPPDAIVQGVRIQDVSISPDGRYLAIVARQNGTAFVMVKDRVSAAAPRTIYEPTTQLPYLPRVCHWAKSARLVCTLSLFLPSGRMARYLDLRMIALNPDGSNRVVLLENDDIAWPVMPRVIDWQRQNPSEVLVANNWTYPEPFSDHGKWSSAYLSKLNIETNKVSSAGPGLPRGNYRKFVGDGRGSAVLATGLEDGMAPKAWTAAARASNSAPWIRLSRLAPHATDLRFEPVALAAGTTDAFMLMDYQGRTALWRVDLSDRRDPILELWHEEFNVHDVLRDGDGALMGVRLATSAAGPLYFDGRARELNALLRAKWPERHNEFLDATANLQHVVVRTWGDATVPAYYLFSGGTESPKLEFIGSSAPELAKLSLAPSRSITVSTNDGRRLFSQLTIPAAAAALKPPLVVVVSDWDEDGTIFDPIAQLLASHGYAVLRTQAASSSADESWEVAPLVDWNGQVYADMLTVIRSLVADDRLDAGRMCLIGAGYGGYVAMLGNVRGDLQPACAIGINTVTDPASALANARSSGLRRSSEKPDGLYLHAKQAEQIRKQAASAYGATLLVHDTLIKEAKALTAALSKANKSRKLVITDLLGDAFIAQTNSEITAFLDEHLPIAEFSRERSLDAK
jgi:dipeptidyl aminopeptidase/acylaminoacyl peptidase